MLKMVVKFKKIRETSKEPKLATNGSAAYDLCADITEDIVLEPGDRKLIPTGVAVAMPSRTDNQQVPVIYVFARSGLACKHGITLANGVGVIDSDYRGEIGVCLYNSSKETYTIHPQDRIAQMAFMSVMQPYFVEVGDLDETARGAGGFGSTGKA